MKKLLLGLAGVSAIVLLVKANKKNVVPVVIPKAPVYQIPVTFVPIPGNIIPGVQQMPGDGGRVNVSGYGM